LQGAEYRAFVETAQKARVLFGADVRDYLNEVNETAKDLYVAADDRDRALSGGEDQDAIKRHHKLLSRLIELAPAADDVFRPYLSL
jgi:hypothetical protein